MYWPRTISNRDLLQWAMLNPLSEVVRERWRWLGHVLRMPADALPRVALSWTPQGRRRRGRPKETWRRSMDKELTEKGLTWETARRKASDRVAWRTLVEAPCASQGT